MNISATNAATYGAGIAALEHLASYPLGDDFFHLDHGTDYFAFFCRLGKLQYYVMEAGGKTVAVGAAVLRSIPASNGAAAYRCWYLCDLKVHPDFRGQHLPLKLLGARFLPNYLRCRRGYAISMNSAGGRPNKVMKLLARFRWLPFNLAGQLAIYTLDFERMCGCRKIIEASLGSIAFLSLAGKKDLLLQSTGQALPVLHLQHGPCAAGGRAEPEPGFSHMFCMPSGDPLQLKLAALNVLPTATASIIAHRMATSDWRFVLTSDI